MDPWEKSVLMHSCYKGHYDIAELLLTHGANVDSIARSGRTPLIAAAFGGHANVVKLLIRHGASLNVQGKKYAEDDWIGYFAGSYCVLPPVCRLTF